MESFSGPTREGTMELPAGLGQAPVGDEAAGKIAARWFALSGSRSIRILAGLLFCLHVLGSVLFAAHGSVTCLGIGGCYGFAAAGAYRMSRLATGTMRARWALVAAGLGLGVLSFVLTLYREYVVGAPAIATGVQDVTLLLRGFPFLMAVCLSRREAGAALAALDAMQVALLGFLASFALLFSAPGYLPVSSDSALVCLTVANVVVALLASVRCFGGAAGEERNFFRMVAGFLWANALLTGLINWFAIERWHVAPGSPLLVFADLPVLGLLLAMGWKAGKTSRREDGGEATLAETACSLSIPVCSLLLAASIVPGHLHLGLGGVALGFVLYGFRSTVVLKKALSAQQELLLTNRSMQDQAFSDALTGIANRRNFDLTLEREWKRAQRSRQPLALLMLDVDHFKSLNDTHGHLGGDACLRQIAGLLRSGLGREADFAARYGGEEFAVLLVDTGIDGARIVGESLRRAVELHLCSLEDGTPVSFTVSIGIASEVPMVQESSVTLVAAADKALYRAKRNGRNRVEIHAWQTDALPVMGG